MIHGGTAAHIAANTEFSAVSSQKTVQYPSAQASNLSRFSFTQVHTAVEAHLSCETVAYLAIKGPTMEKSRDSCKLECAKRDICNGVNFRESAVQGTYDCAMQQCADVQIPVFDESSTGYEVWLLQENRQANFLPATGSADIRQQRPASKRLTVDQHIEFLRNSPCHSGPISDCGDGSYIELHINAWYRAEEHHSEVTFKLRKRGPIHQLCGVNFGVLLTTLPYGTADSLLVPIIPAAEREEQCYANHKTSITNITHFTLFEQVFTPAWRKIKFGLQVVQLPPGTEIGSIVSIEDIAHDKLPSQATAEFILTRDVERIESTLPPFDETVRSRTIHTNPAVCVALLSWNRLNELLWYTRAFCAGVCDRSRCTACM